MENEEKRWIKQIESIIADLEKKMETSQFEPTLWKGQVEGLKMALEVLKEN